MKKRHEFFHLAVPLAIAALTGAAPAAAQHGEHAQHDVKMPASGYRAELISDVEQLESKYLGLAQAMSGKYSWRPAEGVRSVSEVYMHMAAGNFMLLTMAGIEPPETIKAGTREQMMATAREMEQTTDEAKVQELLRHAFAHVKHGIAMISDDELDAKTQLFGREATKRAVLHLVVTHMHEHLGQSIAYARTNQVTPPWSEGGN